jgi:hypothetical protein
MPYPAAYARFRQAEAILAEGGTCADAATAIQASHVACAELDAAPLRHEIEALACRARVTVTADRPREAPQRPFGLTERELTGLARLAGPQAHAANRVEAATARTASDSSSTRQDCRSDAALSGVWSAHAQRVPRLPRLPARPLGSDA